MINLDKKHKVVEIISKVYNSVSNKASSTLQLDLIEVADVRKMKTKDHFLKFHLNFHVICHATL